MCEDWSMLDAMIAMANDDGEDYDPLEIEEGFDREEEEDDAEDDR